VSRSLETEATTTQPAGEAIAAHLPGRRPRGHAVNAARATAQHSAARVGHGDLAATTDLVRQPHEHPAADAVRSGKATWDSQPGGPVRAARHRTSTRGPGAVSSRSQRDGGGGRSDGWRGARDTAPSAREATRHVDEGMLTPVASTTSATMTRSGSNRRRRDGWAVGRHSLASGGRSSKRPVRSPRVVAPIAWSSRSLNRPDRAAPRRSDGTACRPPRFVRRRTPSACCRHSGSAAVVGG